MAANIDSVFQSLDNGNSPVELLMVGFSPNQANQCAIALRNAGQAVHIETAQGHGDLLQLLETEPGDLVIIDADNKDLPPQKAIDAVRNANPSAAIVLVSNEPTFLLELASEYEVRDVIGSLDPVHIAFVIRREHQTLLLRQEMARLRHKLQEAERRFDSLMGKSRDAVAYVHEGMHIHANAVYCEMFGIDEQEEVEGLPLMDLITPDARQAFKKALRTLERKDSFSTQIDCQDQNGRTFQALMEFSPAQVDGEPCTQIVIRDQSLHQELQARIDELTNRDPDTELFNRHAFMERLEGVLAAEEPQAGNGLVQVSIRNFAEMRDHAGIESADKLLKVVADILRQTLPSAHTVARFGDHDFVLLVTHADSLAEQGERCLAALRQHDFMENTGIVEAPEFSIGVTPCPADRISSHELIHRSCRATKQAHAGGEGHQLAIFNDENPAGAEDGSAEDHQTVELIDHALEHDQFQLMYQPIVSLQGDTRENYSVLVRLIGHDGNELPPDMFWAQARSANRLAEIDRWVVRSAIRELVKHRHDGKKINFHITLSREGFTDESMLLWVCDCLREFKAKGAWLAFQFNEQELRSNVPAAKKLIEGLKKINCRVAISHYQDATSSKTLLQHLPIDIIKLSPECMSSLANNAGKQDQLSEVNERLQKAGYQTIASGVEDANSLAILWNVGVNYIQGFFLQEPSTNISFEDA